MPAAPRYDPDSGENRFEWIIRNAPKARAERVHFLLDQRLMRKRTEQAGNAPARP